VVSLPALHDGVYVVAWRTLSAADGHTAEGTFSFGVGDVAGVTPTGRHDLHDEGDPADAAGRWLVYAGLIAGLGVPVFARVVLRTVPHARPLRIVGALLAVAAVATAVLAARAASESGAALLEYLAGSRNGQLQLARAVVLSVGAAVVLVAAGRRPALASWAGAIAAMIAIALLVAAGHAAAGPPVAIAAQFAHVGAVAIWLGGIGCLLALLVRPSLLGIARGAVPMTQCVPRFSALALASIGLVVGTGTYAAWSQTATFDVFASEYGRTLALKIGLVLAALGIGAVNFFDGGRGRPWLGGLQSRLGIEVGLALVVLLVAATLSRTPPPAAETGVALQPLPDAFGETVPGLTLSLLPGRPGVNGVEVTGVGAVGSLPAELTLDRLDAAGSTRIELIPVDGTGDAVPMPSVMDHGATLTTPATGEPAWTGSAIVLPAGSEWNANVSLLSSDGELELARQRFAFTMGADVLAAGRERPLVDPVAIVSLALLVGGALGVGLGVGGWRLPRCDAAASRLVLLVGGTIGGLLGLAIGASSLLSG
jgi:copper transport protein